MNCSNLRVSGRPPWTIWKQLLMSSFFVFSIVFYPLLPTTHCLSISNRNVSNRANSESIDTTLSSSTALEPLELFKQSDGNEEPADPHESSTVRNLSRNGSAEFEATNSPNAQRFYSGSIHELSAELFEPMRTNSKRSYRKEVEKESAGPTESPSSSESSSAFLLSLNNSGPGKKLEPKILAEPNESEKPIVTVNSAKQSWNFSNSEPSKPLEASADADEEDAGAEDYEQFDRDSDSAKDDRAGGAPVVREPPPVVDNNGHDSTDYEDEDSDHNDDEDEEPTEAEASDTDLENLRAKKSNIFIEMSQMYKTGLNELIRRFFPFFVDRIYELSSVVDQKCMSSIVRLFYAIQSEKAWALRFFDASTHFPTSVIDGTLTDFGDYDGCLSIRAPDEDEENASSTSDDQSTKSKGQHIFGKYCLALVKPDLPPKPGRIVRHRQQMFNLSGKGLDGTVFEDLSHFTSALYYLGGYRLGICMPSTCQAKDLEAIANKLLNNYSLKVRFNDHCDSKEEPRTLTAHQRTALYILVFTMSIVLLMTMLDVLARRKLEQFREDSKFDCRNSNPISNLAQGPPSSRLDIGLSWLLKAISVWSVIGNVRKLFRRSSIDQNGHQLMTIHGIKILTICWIMVTHTYLFGGFYNVLWLYKRLVQVIDVPSLFWFQAVFNAWVLVDTFFFMSGLLLVYTMLPILDKTKGRMSFLLYTGHRLVRLLPAMIGALCIQFLWPIVFRGPPLLDNSVHNYMVTSCEQNWWSNLLFVSNWVEPAKMCLINYWYVSADFQMYLMSFGLIILLHHRPQLGIVSLLALLFGSIGLTGLITLYYDLSPTILTDHMINDNYIHDHLALSYTPTFQHFAPYCIGMLVGYLLLNNPQVVDQLSTVTKSMLWASAPVLSLAVLFAPYRWNAGSAEPSRIESALYAALHRVMWTAGVGWVTLASLTGHGGIVSRILQAKVLIPLSRLTYGIYLVHLPVIYMKFYSSKDTMYWDNVQFFGSAFSSLCLSALLAFSLYILFEAPAVRLEKLLLCQKSNRKYSVTKAINDNRISTKF